MATVASTSTSSATWPSETQWRPPATSRARVTTSWASRDLPTPPGPVTVTSPGAVQADARCCSSTSRPTNDVAVVGTRAGPLVRLAAQDAEVRRHRVRAGVHPELGRQRRAAGLERTHRTGPVAGQLQSPDQRSMGPLVQRMGGGQSGVRARRPRRGRPARRTPSSPADLPAAPSPRNARGAVAATPRPDRLRAGTGRGSGRRRAGPAGRASGPSPGARPPRPWWRPVRRRRCSRRPRGGSRSAW